MTLDQLAVDHKLTPRETCVFQAIASGELSIAMAANELGISPRTTQFHCGNIYAKLGVGTRKGLVTFLTVAGILSATCAHPGHKVDPAGAYILRLEAAIRAWKSGDGGPLSEIADELA